MWRSSILGVRELIVKSQPRFAFQQWNTSKSWNKKPKRSLSESAQCQQAIGDIYLTETWRPDALHRGLEIGKSQPRSKVGNFERMSWLNGSFFGVAHRGFLKEGVKTYLMAPMSPLNSPPFLHRHIYSLWVHAHCCMQIEKQQCDRKKIQLTRNEFMFIRWWILTERVNWATRRLFPMDRLVPLHKWPPGTFSFHQVWSSDKR
jgi:hypothetical protein